VFEDPNAQTVDPSTVDFSPSVEENLKHSSALSGRWFCVQIWSNLDRLAEAGLKQAGFRTFFPQVAKPTPEEKRPLEGNWRFRPLFPGYGFIAFDPECDPWWRATDVFGVAHLFKLTPEKPLPLPVGAVETFIAQADDQGVIYPKIKDRRRLVKGEVYRVKRGPLAGINGICSWSTRKRVELLLIMLSGRSVKTTFDTADVVAVS
jgi:transcriptional antiterminator RfaH